MRLRKTSRDWLLVERLRAGEPAAWQELWQTEGRAVLRFAQARLRDADQAEELRQDVFLEVWRSIDRFEGRSSLSTWMLGIAHHLASKRRHRTGLRAARFAPLDLAAGVVSASAPERALDAARLLARCAEIVVAEIPPWPRAVFEQHVLLGRSLRTVAHALGRSTEAAKVSLFRTRQRLRARVDVSGVLDPLAIAARSQTLPPRPRVAERAASDRPAAEQVA
jgi:RNA polymerase sigma-70 factor (ECF subfamily)